jgi:SAM-dependent methyltransferase
LKSGRIRKFLEKLRGTPLHPQWFAFQYAERNLRASCAQLSGTVLDVGCAHCKPKAYLPPDAVYVGLDYYSTAVDWYGTRPDIFGDAQELPLLDESIEHALLLDVLEHLPDPQRCLSELNRVIKPGGTLTIHVPFLYPLHDEPLDFHRWTKHGLRNAATRNGYRVALESESGHPLETAALNMNIALSKSIINWFQGKNPLLAVALLAPFMILTINCVAWSLATLSRKDSLMPIYYRMIWIKN